jgi:hypothetical protein
MLSAWSGQLSETKNSGRRQRHGQCDGLTVRYGVGSCSDLARHAVVFHTRSGALVREPGSVCVHATQSRTPPAAHAFSRRRTRRRGPFRGIYCSAAWSALLLSRARHVCEDAAARIAPTTRIPITLIRVPVRPRHRDSRAPEQNSGHVHR